MKLKTILAGALALGLATAASAQDKTKVGFIFVGPIGDGGWTYEHNKGRLAVEYPRSSWRRVRPCADDC